MTSQVSATTQVAAPSVINETSITVLLDDSVKDSDLFKSLDVVKMNRPELFKYAIMMWEVPPKVVESDFEYLQSKVPGLEMMLSDFINFSNKTIYNISKDDRVKKLVSEAVGVGLGLKYSVSLLGVNPNKLKKIGVAEEGKYLDYSVIDEGKEYEIETKGTVAQYYSGMKNDIIAKKSNTNLKAVYLRFGTIALIKNEGDPTESKCVVMDDPPDASISQQDDSFVTQLWNYGALLSYIIDPKYYNKYVRPLRQNKLQRVKVNDKKFFAKYNFAGKVFYGECFDYRLIKDVIGSVVEGSPSLKVLFKRLTKKVGKVKFFIGLDERVVVAINRKEEKFLSDYNSEPMFIDEGDVLKFLDRDGILIVKAKNRKDRQMEDVFPEREVRDRLKLFRDFVNGHAHRCNAPCRSKGIEGKPCEKMTFRKNCYFHR